MLSVLLKRKASTVAEQKAKLQYTFMGQLYSRLD